MKLTPRNLITQNEVRDEIKIFYLAEILNDKSMKATDLLSDQMIN